MYKKTLYPKTKRISKESSDIEITEKLDGSNLGIFKKDGELWVAQRNLIFNWDKIKNNGSKGLYKGLFGWLSVNAEEIKDKLYEGSGVFGEWIGTGVIKYGGSDIDSRFYIFAKARLEGSSPQDFSISNLYYDRDLIPYAFEDRNIPKCISFVPCAERVTFYPTKEHLDQLYDRYCRVKNRKVEGFIINQSGSIKKYVRYKNGKLTEHTS